MIVHIKDFDNWPNEKSVYKEINTRFPTQRMFMNTGDIYSTYNNLYKTTQIIMNIMFSSMYSIPPHELSKISHINSASYF